MSPSGLEEFHEHYEDAADVEHRTLSALAVNALLDCARNGRFGEYHQLWPVIAEKATLPQAGPVLLTVLESDAPYLSRYHCAAALLKLAGESLAAFTPVSLSSGGPQSIRANLDKITTLLRDHTP
jgi:hypothetical protein